MSKIIGPSIVTDGLVLYLDSANKRSYAGEPTINLAPAGQRTCSQLFSHYQTHRGSSGSYSFTLLENIDGRKDVIKLECPASIDEPYADWGFSASKDGGSEVGDVYTVSFDFKKLEDNSPNPNLSITYINGYKDPDQSSAATLGNGYLIDLDNGWKRYVRDATITNAGDTWWRFGHHSNGNASAFYVDNFQVELKDHVTDFVDGIRSSTNGWKDLVGVRHFDLTNISYDQDGFYFDGIDDEISRSISGVVGNTWSFGCWIKVLSHDGDSKIFISANLPYLAMRYSTRRFLISYRDASGTQRTFADTTGRNINQWYYVFATHQGNTIKLYVDGELVIEDDSYIGSSNFGGALSLGNHTNRSFYTNCQIPIVQVYDRAITDSEVFQNYNSLKGRYSL